MFCFIIFAIIAPMKILSGSIVAEKFLEEIKLEAENLKQITNRMPKFAIVQIADNPASNLYISNKKKAAEKIGFEYVHHKFDCDVDFNTVGHVIANLNASSEIDGIIVQLPVPAHLKQIVYLISPNKDIDGLGYIQQAKLALNLPGLRPCTPFGVLKLLDAYDISVECNVCIVGRSVLVGQSLALMLLHKNATVTIVHSKTKNIENCLKNADIVFLAAGMPNFIDMSMLSANCIVIDIAISKITDPNDASKSIVTGDLNHDAHEHIKAYSPVPGGIGPMTIASLMHNTLLAYKNSL